MQDSLRDTFNPAAPPATGRLKSGPAPELVRSANRMEVENGPILYRGLSLADVAHVLLLMETGILPHEPGRRLLAALLEAHAIPAHEFPFDPALGDAYKNRERHLLQQVDDAGGWLRAGRARREATNVAYRLAVRRRLLALLAALESMLEALLRRAAEYRDALMPDYTYLQPAQPTTLAHYLLGFAYPLLRDGERLRACFRRINRCPAGIGSVNGSRLGLDRSRLAHMLGFDAAIHHTRDAMWQADTPIELASTAVTLLVNLDRLAEDFQVWTTQEFHLLELDDAYTRTSVIMPQKKNPYSLAYVRGLAGTSIGHLAAMANVGRTTTGQPDSRIFAYGEIPRLLDRAAEAVELMAGVTSTFTADRPRMAARAGMGFSQATDLAEALMLTAGLPYESAHHVVGELVARAVEQDIPAARISPHMLEQAAHAVLGRRLTLSPQQLEEILDPQAIVATRTTLGGAAPQEVDAMRVECREKLAAARGWRERTAKRIESAEAALLERAAAVTAPPNSSMEE